MWTMKTLLKLLGAVSLTTVSTSSVIACGVNNDSTKLLNSKISQNLKLTDTNGKGLISPTINVDTSDKSKVTWEIDTGNIKITELVGVDKKAKDKESFDFLKDILKITIDSGTKLDDAVFNATELNGATLRISDINVDLKPLKNKSDFYITNGSYNIIFNNGTTETNKYKLITKVSNENDKDGVLHTISIHISQLDKSDFNDIFQDEFKVGKSVSNFQVGMDLISKLNTSKDKIKAIFGIERLINQGNTKILIMNNTKKSGNFDNNDKITIACAYEEVTDTTISELMVNV